MPRPAVDIRFIPGFPAALRPQVKAMLSRFAPFVARRADRFWVEYDVPTESDGDAAISASLQYRHAYIMLQPSFFKMDEQSQVDFAAHELAHILADPIAKYAGQLVQDFVPEPAKEHCWRVIADLCDAETEDIARAMVALTAPSR